MRRAVLVLGLGLAAFFASEGNAATPPPQDSRAAGPAAPPSAAPFRPADRPREFRFPADHGRHPEARTEWWYLTGRFDAEDGGVYGFQFTIFRSGVAGAPASRPSALAVRDIYLGHAAVTDVAGERFLHGERGPVGRLGRAEAAIGALDVRLDEWRLREEPDGSWRVTADALDRTGASPRPFGFTLTVRPRGPVVLHGESPGWSRKGPLPHQSSYYASLVDLAGEGELRLDGRAKRGRARAWFDHEFGSDQLAADVVGWDWYSLRLDDGAALMLYRLRLASGGDSPFSSGTFVAPDGAVRHLKADEVRTGTLARFRSPRSGADYPVARRLEIPALALRLDVRPAVLDQELTTDRTTRVTYYEGFVTATGERAGKPVAAEGYQELVGYAGGAARF